MPRPLMNEEELGKWILRKLGAPFWKVELTCEHLADCIEDARRWFAAKKGVQKVMVVGLAAGQTTYSLPDEVELVIEVADDRRMGLWPNLSYAFGWDQVVVGVDWSFDSNKWFVSELVQRMQYLQTSERVLDAQFEWRQDNRNLLILNPNPQSSKIAIIYKSNEVILEQLAERDHDLVKRFALMCAKKTVGRVRSKYPGGMTGAGGQTVELDGQMLLDEAREENEKLQEEIMQSAYPMMFMTG